MKSANGTEKQFGNVGYGRIEQDRLPADRECSDSGAIRVRHGFARTSIDLLPRQLLVKTGPVDHADWNYRPLVRIIQRQRFRLCRLVLGERTYRRVLVVGYGSGVFLPELYHQTNELYGIDIHRRCVEVQNALATIGVAAKLRTGSAERMPFPDNSFDAVIAISALEFIEDLDACAREIRRVLSTDGVFVCVTPSASPILDLGLKILTGADAKTDFSRRREHVLPTLRRHLQLSRTVWFPRKLHRLFPVYCAAEFRKRTT